MPVTTKQEADAYDRILDAAAALAEMITAGGILMDEYVLEELTIFLAGNSSTVASILKGQRQMDASIKDAVKQARSRLPEGEGTTRCVECGEVIPEARRKALPGVRLCVECQMEIEKHQTTATGYSRRGSKDSQLR